MKKYIIYNMLLFSISVFSVSKVNTDNSIQHKLSQISKKMEISHLSRKDARNFAKDLDIYQGVLLNQFKHYKLDYSTLINLRYDKFKKRGFKVLEEIGRSRSQGKNLKSIINRLENDGLINSDNSKVTEKFINNLLVYYELELSQKMESISNEELYRLLRDKFVFLINNQGSLITKSELIKYKDKAKYIRDSYSKHLLLTLDKLVSVKSARSDAKKIKVFLMECCFNLKLTKNVIFPTELSNVHMYENPSIRTNLIKSYIAINALKFFHSRLDFAILTLDNIFYNSKEIAKDLIDGSISNKELDALIIEVINYYVHEDSIYWDGSLSVFPLYNVKEVMGLHFRQYPSIFHEKDKAVKDTYEFYLKRQSASY